VKAAELFALGFRDPDPARIDACSRRMFLLMEHATSR
jgi:hypothetical protein